MMDQDDNFNGYSVWIPGVRSVDVGRSVSGQDINRCPFKEGKHGAQEVKHAAIRDSEGSCQFIKAFRFSL